MRRIRLTFVLVTRIPSSWWALYLFACIILVHALQAPLVEASTVSQETNSDNVESNLSFLFAAFVIVWGLFFGYLLVMLRRGRDLRRDVEELQRDILKRND